MLVDRGVKLESVMPTLVVLAKGSNIPGYLVPVSSDQLAYLKHGAVAEAERSSAREQRAKYLNEYR